MITKDNESQVVDVTRLLIGSWRLPQLLDGTAVVSFHPDGMFIWHNSTCNKFTKAREIVVGPSLRGNWHVRNSVHDGRSWFGTIFGTRTMAALPGPRPVDHDLHLVLNFTALPESVLNINLLGLRCDIANWALNAWELTGLHAHRLSEVTADSLIISLYGQEQLWLKVR